MGIFKNLFSCTCIDDVPKKDDTIKTDMTLMKDEMRKMQSEITLLFKLRSDTDGEMRRLEDKLNTHFQILDNKIDSVILILNTRLNVS